jgi:hypothetical protein
VITQGKRRKKMRKLFCAGIFSFLVVGLVAGTANAQEIQLQLYERAANLTSVFEAGHEGDLSRIVGFDYEMNVLLGEQRTPIGTEVAEVRLPEGQYLDLSAEVLEAEASGTLSIPGIGTFQIKGFMIALGGPAAAQTGDVFMSWVETYQGGTDILSGYYGLGSGAGKVNLFTGAGEVPLTMVLVPAVAQ